MDLLEAAKKAADAILGDMSATEEETIKALEELKAHVEMLIQTLY